MQVQKGPQVAIQTITNDSERTAQYPLQAKTQIITLGRR